MRKIILALAAAAATLPAAPAFADPPPWAPAHGRRAHDAERYDRYGRYAQPVVISRNSDIWRDGRDGRYYCRRDNGTTGLIIGAAGGALVGREVDGGRNRTTGTIVGAALGALIGREIDRGELRCR